MEGASRIPGFYPQTPAVSRYNTVNGHSNSPSGSIGRAGGPIRRTPAQTVSRARAHSTPYARPPLQNTPGSGGRPHREDDDEARIKKSLGEKTAELVGTLVSGVKDWFSRTPRREHVQSVVPRKTTPQRSMTSRMEEGQPDPDEMAEVAGDMFSPSLQPHYAGHTPWIVKQRKDVSAQEPPAFPLPNLNPAQRRQESQSKYATLPAKRSHALTTMPANKRARQHPREWELSKDRFAERDQETLEWCKKYKIDIRALATGTQKRPPLPSFADIQRFDALRNDAPFFERQGIRYIPPPSRKTSSLRHATSSYELSRIAKENSALYNAAFIEPGDSSASKLHAWREILRLKEQRARVERENAQLDRSMQRNGYSPAPRAGNRTSSRVGRAGDVSDDVWILPGSGGRPGSAGSVRSARSRGSPAATGSLRSQRASQRPRGRDVFEMEVQEVDEPMVDEQVKVDTGFHAPPPPPSSHITSLRRKRPGYFSAREEDLDALDMDMDDVTPARKKQRLNTRPKFAALLDPSRRENVPLRDGEDVKMVYTPHDEELERVKNELKALESPAFILPPSARKGTPRKEEDLMDMEQESPTKGGEKEFTFQFGNGNSTVEITVPESNFEPTTVEEGERRKTPSKAAMILLSILSEQKSQKSDEDMDIPVENPEENEVEESKPAESQPSAPSEFSLPPTQNSTQSTTQSSFGKDAVNGGFSFGEIGTGMSQNPVSFTSAVTSFEEDVQNEATEKPVVAVKPPQFLFGSAPKQAEAQSDNSAEKQVDAKPTPAFNFRESNKASPEKAEEKPALEFTSKSAMDGDSAEKTPESHSAPVYNFGKSNKASPEKVDEKPVLEFRFNSAISNPAPVFNFDESDTASAEKVEEKPAPKFPFKATMDDAKDSLTMPIGQPSFTPFGAPAKSDTEKPVFASAKETPDTNGTGKDEEAPKAPASTFGTTSGFTFGAVAPPATTSTESPKKDAPISPAPRVSFDDSMDITDSPPTSRNTSFTGAPTEAPSQFTGFKFPTSAPTSAPAAPTQAAKAPTFGFQVNGAKPEATGLKFNGAEKTATTGFTTTNGAFGTPKTPGFATSTTPAVPGIGSFGSAFSKKEPEKPAVQPFTFQFGNTAAPSFPTTPSKPAQTPMFAPQPSAPFGSATTTLFGNSSFPQSVTSPSATSPAPPTYSFNFNAPTPTANTSTFAPTGNTTFSGGNPFGYGAQNPVSNPFAARPPAATSPAPFQGTNSAPLSPQIQQQLPTFPGVQGAQPAFPTAGPFTAPAPSFQFGQVSQSPMFTLGSSQMQRSSSDAGPNNASPSGRKFAQPGRRRFNRR